jgi:hypothetical protein
MTLNKAKQVLLSEVQRLRSKAEQKRREALKLDLEAKQLQDQAEKLK